MQVDPFNLTHSSLQEKKKTREREGVLGFSADFLVPMQKGRSNRRKEEKKYKHRFERDMHPPLTLHRHPMCAEIIEQFQKCHEDHPIAKFFNECTELKIKLDRCFREEKALKRKANHEESKKLRERLQAYRKENAEKTTE